MSPRAALDPFLADFEGRATHPALDVRARSIQVGQALEDVRAALAALVADPKQQDWLAIDKRLRAMAPLLPEAVMAQFFAIWKRRCAMAHSTGYCPDPEEIPLDIAATRASIAKLAGYIAGLRSADGLSFAELVYAQQRSSTPLRLAEELAAVLLRALDAEAARDLVRLVALERHIAPPPTTSDAAADVRTTLRELSLRAQASACDALVAVGLAALEVAGEPGKAALGVWFALHGATVPANPRGRMNVLAIYLRVLDEHEYELWGWALVSPPIAGLDRACNLPLPMKFKGMAELCTAVSRITKHAGAVLAKWPGGAVPVDWGETTLMISVDEAAAGLEFERAPDRHRYLMDAFLSVAVRPIRDGHNGTTRNAPTIDSPALPGSNSVRFDVPLELRRVEQQAKGKAATFLGPWAAASDGRGVPPAVQVFDGVPCSVSVRDLTLGDALPILFPNDQDRSVKALFQRVKSLRQEQRVLLLWADPEYNPPDLTAM